MNVDIYLSMLHIQLTVTLEQFNSNVTVISSNKTENTLGK